MIHSANKPKKQNIWETNQYFSNDQENTDVFPLDRHALMLYITIIPGHPNSLLCIYAFLGLCFSISPESPSRPSDASTRTLCRPPLWGVLASHRGPRGPSQQESRSILLCWAGSLCDLKHVLPPNRSKNLRSHVAVILESWPKWVSPRSCST